MNDSGTGSFRTAVSSSNRIVVFDVGGIIELKSDVTIKSNITILGQTAPSPGITLRYRTVRPNGDNIIMRFIRIRRGEEKDVNDGADATWARNFKGMILDHCSFSWSIDEIASFYDNRNYTMQWCTLGEALANPGHSKGEHSYGGIWGGKEASFHHNFLCHMQNRVPRFCGARYNWDGYDKTKYSNAIQAEIPVMLEFAIVASVQINIFAIRCLAAIYSMVAELPHKASAQSRIFLDKSVVIFDISRSVSHSMAVFNKQERC
jgi:pectate lyase